MAGIRRLNPFMEPHVEPRERTPEHDLQDAEYQHCHANGFHTSTIGLASPGNESRSCGFAELLIDCEEDRTLRAVLIGMLREEDRWAVVKDSRDDRWLNHDRRIRRRRRARTERVRVGGRRAVANDS
jgi:hypothetical protein